MTPRSTTLVVSLAIGVAAVTGTAHPPSHPPGDATAADISSAVATWQSRVDERPEDTIALSRLGGALLDAGRRTGRHDLLADAEDIFEQLRLINPNSAAASMGIAYSRLGGHRHVDALEAARDVADLRPDDPATWALLGDIHIALGNYAEAEAFFVRLADARISLETLARLGMIHEHRGRDSQADRAYHDALDAGQLTGAAPAALAWCHTMIGEFDLGLGDADEAIAHFNAALVLDPASGAPAWRLAQVDLLSGRPTEAAQRMRDLVKRLPRPAYRVTLARAERALGDEAAARDQIALAEHAMLDELEHGELGHVRELVELWVSEGTHLDQAVGLAQLDIDRVRSDVGAFETLAWAQFAAGHVEQAVDSISRALRLSDASATTLHKAGLIHAAAGNDLQSRILLSRAASRNHLVSRQVRAPHHGDCSRTDSAAFSD